MDAPHPAGVAKKACTRCRTQKRRCDRFIPECGLCRRLHQPCQYEARMLPSPSPTSSSPFDAALPLETVRLGYIKGAIVDKLGPTSPGVVFLKYNQSIHPWFPIFSQSSQDRFPQSWDEAALDCTLLALCIGLLCSPPHSFPGDGSPPNEFQSKYLHAKSWIAEVEGLGINSVKIVQARILVTLFEVAHGFYPAAYISIAATVRAANALRVHPCSQTSTLPSSTNQEEAEETVVIECAIRIVDRYITIQSGPHPSLTRSIADSIHDSKRIFHPNGREEDPTSPLWQFSRTFEVSTLLDNLHLALHNPTPEKTFNAEEVLLLVETTNSLRAIIAEEIGDTDKIYSGGLALCDTGLLVAYDNGSKVQVTDGVSANCRSLGASFLDLMLTNMGEAISPFVNGARAIDFDRLPPFAIFLVYKAAALVTERVWLAPDSSEALRKLRILRGFLTLASARWLCCQRYLDLLNEDTTPRILKALERQ